jgi:iron(III) transport system ATP-binding protein
VLSLVPSHHDHHIGERIGVRLETDHVVAFEPVDHQIRTRCSGGK